MPAQPGLYLLEAGIELLISNGTFLHRDNFSRFIEHSSAWSPPLVPCFWERPRDHHPGIDSLRLPPDIAAGWKKRIKTRTVRAPDGSEQTVARQAADDVLITIRAFHLDLAQWALDEPARWGP